MDAASVSTVISVRPGYSSRRSSKATREALYVPDRPEEKARYSTSSPAASMGPMRALNTSGVIWLVVGMLPPRTLS